MAVDAETVLATLRDEVETKDAELAAQFYTLEDYYERKLWYQLSEVLKHQIYANDHSKSIRLKLFDNFILTFSDKINQLQLVEFLTLSLVDSSAHDSLEYLTNLKTKIIKEMDSRTHGAGVDDINDYEIIQALLYLEDELARVKLELGFIDEASAIIDQSEKKIEQLTSSVDLRVYSSLYFVKAQLMKLRGDFNAFYYNSLLFLACIPDLNKLADKEQIVHDIAISGLLGDKIFNFGEVIMHEIFNYLQSAWLKGLVLSLNNGDLKSFNELIGQTAQLQELPDIANRVEFLKQKVCVMAFIELVFNKPTTSRCISYTEILEQIPLLKNGHEIEHLVMRCLRLGLMRGLINQVDENVEVSWIHPRTMTHAQVESMRAKMALWNEKVGALTEYMGGCGGEVLA